MEKEVSVITRIGECLIALAIAIGIGLCVFSVTHRATAASVEVVNSRENSRALQNLYDDYDDALVTGNDVQDVIYKYSKLDIAILVATNPWVDACKTLANKVDTTSINNCTSGIKGSYTNHSNGLPVAYVYRNSTYAKNQKNVSTFNNSYAYYYPNSQGQSTALRFINYGTLIGSNSSTTAGVCVRSYMYNSDRIYSPCLYIADHVVWTSSSFATNEHGRLIRNNTLVNINKPGRTEYIAPEGVFKSYLVKTENGEILGLAFIQTV